MIVRPGRFRRFRDNLTYIAVPFFGFAMLAGMSAPFLMLGSPGPVTNGHYFLINHDTFEVSRAIYFRMVTLEWFYLHIVIPMLIVSAAAIFSNQPLLRNLTDPSLRSYVWPYESGSGNPSARS
jgi:hypothetical protein